MNATPPDTPSAAQPPLPSPAAPPPPREGWAVNANRGVQWWTEGWRLFTASPVIWIVITLLYVALFTGLHFIPIIGQIAATVLTPVLAAGVLLGCRKLDRGGEFGVADLFGGFGANVAPLIVLGVLYFVGWLLAFALCAGIAIVAFGAGALQAVWSGDPMQMARVFGIGALVVLLMLLLVAVPLMMAYWFAPALVALRNDEPLGSLRTSFVACLRNIPPFTIYGLLGLVFGIVASIPFFLGWLVLGPVFAGSLYASYKDIFGV